MNDKLKACVERPTKSKPHKNRVLFMSQTWNQQKESVWSYPRPPIVVPFEGELLVEFNGKLIAKTSNALRVLETSHPPVYFFPPDDVDHTVLFRKVRDAYCAYKGCIKFYDIAVDQKRSNYAAWYFPKPNPGYEALKGYIAYFAHKMDACYVNGELVIPQPGEFFGGWITSNIIGPYKGMPGTDNW